ncbi:hypothetical protein RIR_jg5641.t1 [Rhizophagus irregularis DAOM 181602=DAOM 197198]|uniref:Uncharacterized protein n=1 Tax=Rhizophagus irregularis (strain DAOM 181602 / DAOM 197198 / MUCL 43194) TaxID=747089 RepID=U9U820_RHIID|nr:hypothetical protein RIR_jg5641.t1 [Rhizophagus irregularis DAOM 181602=DAOM 197198]
MFLWNAKVYDGTILTLRVILATDLHGFTQLSLPILQASSASNNFLLELEVLELEELRDSDIPIIFNTIYVYWHWKTRNWKNWKNWNIPIFQ